MNELESAVRRLDRDTTWRLESSVTVRTDVGHPQGMTPWGDDWLVSTVRWETASGSLLVVDAAGELVESLDVTDGERFHPGGLDRSGAGCWAAVAEYRPDSTTTVMWVDEHLDATTAFRFPDHLGAICELEDSTLFAVSWGSRNWYRLDTEGRVLAVRPNVSAVVDLQDLQSLSGPGAIGTGVGSIVTPHGELQLGAVVCIDADDLCLDFETPISAWMQSGRIATYNATHLTAAPDRVDLHCLVDARPPTSACGPQNSRPLSRVGEDLRDVHRGPGNVPGLEGWLANAVNVYRSVRCGREAYTFGWPSDVFLRNDLGRSLTS